MHGGQKTLDDVLPVKGTAHQSHGSEVTDKAPPPEPAPEAPAPDKNAGDEGKTVSPDMPFRLVSMDYDFHPMTDAEIADELRRLSTIYTEAKAKATRFGNAFTMISELRTVGVPCKSADYDSSRKARDESAESLKAAESLLRDAIGSVPLAILARREREAESAVAKADELRKDLAEAPAKLRKALADFLAEAFRYYGVPKIETQQRAHALFWAKSVVGGGPSNAIPLWSGAHKDGVSNIGPGAYPDELGVIYGAHPRALPAGVPSIREQVKDLERGIAEATSRREADRLAGALIETVFPQGAPVTPEPAEKE